MNISKEEKARLIAEVYEAVDNNQWFDEDHRMSVFAQIFDTVISNNLGTKTADSTDSVKDANQNGSNLDATHHPTEVSAGHQPKEGIDKQTAKQVIEGYVEGDLDWDKPVEFLPMTIEDMLYEYVAQFGIDVYDDGFGGETYKQPQSPTEPVSGERTGEEAAEILSDLVQIKRWKDRHGKDMLYNAHQPVVWRKAFEWYDKTTTPPEGATE